MTQRIAYMLILLTVAELLCWGWVSADDAGLAVWRPRLLLLDVLTIVNALVLLFLWLDLVASSL